MLTYEKIVKEGVMTSSVASLLLTNDKALQKKMLSSASYVEQMFHICMFYRSLIQAYVIGEAISKDVTIDKLGYSERLISGIKLCWPQNDVVHTSKNEKEVFSFLSDAYEFFAPDSAVLLSQLQDLYNDSLDPSVKNTNEIDDEVYVELLRAFSLLAVTNVDFEEMKFSFPYDINDSQSDRFKINCSPFIFFCQKRSVSEYITEANMAGGLTLVSARKGEKNGDLLLDLTEFHRSSGGRGYFVRTIRRQASKDEKIYQICRALGMDTEWYEMDDYLCNMAFLVRITNVTGVALKKFWKENTNSIFRSPNRYIEKKLRFMFGGDPEMCRCIDRCGQITVDDLDRVFYGLYIEFGVFKTMRELLKDDRNYSYSKELFDVYMDCLFQMHKNGKGGISTEQRAKYEDKCEKNIKSRLEKLSSIVSQEHPRYKNRARAIEAEWRAYYILKASGIHAENLFADEESMLSIDDYFCMIKNPSTTLQSDLNDVLSLLTEMYGAIMETGAEFDEKVFREHVLRIRNQNSQRDTIELFDYLCQLVEKSKNHVAIRQLLGREVICDPHTLENLAESIKECFSVSQNFEPSQILTKKEIFISYAHANKDKVFEYVKELKKRGYRVFLDDERFVIGDDWSQKAQDEMKSSDCAAVLLFMSRKAAVSNAIRFELEEAEIQGKVIIPVNLETENISEYLKTMEHELSDKRDVVSFFRKKLPESQLSGSDQDKNKIWSRIEQVMHSGEDDEDENFIEERSYNAFELAVANFYAFLKFSDGIINNDKPFDWTEEIDKTFHNSTYEISRCVYPLVTSVKETKVKRDKIALMGYEILRDTGEKKRGTNYIFSSVRLAPDDYYCLPNYRTTGEDGVWMVNPLMINHRLLRDESSSEV